MDAKHCRGCDSDFYNTEGAGIAMGGSCWSLKDAEIVTRFRQGWWDRPPPWGPKRTKVNVPKCFSQSGRAAFMAEDE